MHVINVRGVNEALCEGMRYLDACGVHKPSRAGEVIVAPGPVMTVYERPLERVLFWAIRDANPFFHVLEGLYFLHGSNDVEWIARFNKRMREFSNDGRTLSGSYGYRWRHHFMDDEASDWVAEIDQLDMVVELLKRHPNTRRAVIQMWDCRVDLAVDESLNKDVCCNDLIFLWNNDGALDMTVMCRSNDIIWGCYGSNAVHFSMLQEYLAARIGLEVGKYFQFSNNYHAYQDIFEKNRSLINYARDLYKPPFVGPYDTIRVPRLPGYPVKHYPLVSEAANFDEELRIFMDDEKCPDDLFLSVEIGNPFLRYAAALRRAYLIWKREKDYARAIEVIQMYCPEDFDFAVAGVEWLERRRDRV